MKRTLMIGVFWLAALSAFAQPEGEPLSPGEERATTFQAVEGPVEESVPGGVLLLVAYGVAWLAVFGYVLRIGRHQSQTMQTLARLEAPPANEQEP
ncbi:MAG: CcmD family protein [Myxococcales bacterium]|nr:CcmD family protein [Myxococcales bacterium]